MKNFWKFVVSFAVLLKRLFVFVVSVFVIVTVYEFLLSDIFERDYFLPVVLGLWFFTAYVVLPRIHRLLSRIYVPDYFIARSRTSDGFLSDPINLALNGNKKEIIKAFEKAGWHQADDINTKTVWRMVYSSVMKKSYPNAPFSPAFLFGRKQELAFQKEVANNPRQRHHVRLWKTPSAWYLPGGYKVDWLGAATYDTSVGLSFLTYQFTHKIEPDVDIERDFLIGNLEKAGMLKNIKKIEHFFPGYEAKNGFGHAYVTDGSLVIADAKAEKS